MAGRFYGKVGYAITEEKAPGVWDDVITTRHYYGDVVRNTVKSQNGSEVNNDITTGNSISVVADEYASGHFFAIKFVEWAGVLWTVTEVTEESPRLLLRLGGVYRGPTS